MIRPDGRAAVRSQGLMETPNTLRVAAPVLDQPSFSKCGPRLRSLHRRIPAPVRLANRNLRCFAVVDLTASSDTSQPDAQRIAEMMLVVDRGIEWKRH